MLDWKLWKCIYRSKKINKFLELDFIYEDHLEIKEEHGLNVQIPYIAHYFKNAKIVPLAISNNLTIEELN